MYSNVTLFTQRSLWDFADLESGFSLLIDLRFEEAIDKLNKALAAGYEYELVQKGLNTANFWKLRTNQIEGDTAFITQILKDFEQYEFIPQLRKFRENLLCLIAAKMGKVKNIRRDEMETVFDELLILKAYANAEMLITSYRNQNPDDEDILYFMGQVQWLGGRVKDGMHSYILALLYAPSDLPVQRIESERLRQLIATYGAEMTPAYAWIFGIASFVPQDELHLNTEKYVVSHRNALTSYRNLQLAQLYLEKNEMRACIQYRKLLKQSAPELYASYYSLIKQYR